MAYNEWVGVGKAGDDLHMRKKWGEKEEYMGKRIDCTRSYVEMGFMVMVFK